jgi:signal transduction histidine kinase
VDDLAIPRDHQPRRGTLVRSQRRQFLTHAKIGARVGPFTAKDAISGRLIAAQEAERGRITQRLHDDLSQRLALLSIGLSSLQAHLPANKQADLSVLQRQAIELSNEIRLLSHELVSPILSVNVDRFVPPI